MQAPSSSETIPEAPTFKLQNACQPPPLSPPAVTAHGGRPRLSKVSSELLASPSLSSSSGQSPPSSLSALNSSSLSSSSSRLYLRSPSLCPSSLPFLPHRRASEDHSPQPLLPIGELTYWHLLESSDNPPLPVPYLSYLTCRLLHCHTTLY
ncbi:hypothetical protein AHAS_Ahas20G0127000 [Arachis hypogaea]